MSNNFKLLRNHIESVRGGSDNCLAKCISFITGIPLEGIPNFYKMNHFWLYVRDYLLTWDLDLVAYTPERAEKYGHILCSGKNKQGIQHVVVTDPQGKLIYDSYPQGGELTGSLNKWVLIEYTLRDQAA